MRSFVSKYSQYFVAFVGLILVAYGGGRLYYHLTGGFTVGNIHSDFSFQPQWEVRPLFTEEGQELASAIEQSYFYLGKGCQSYVFLSGDGEYVLKFFKYQRYRLHPWLEYFPSLSAVVEFREQKKRQKWEKLDHFVQSWKLAFEHLKEETGLLFVHLNKTDNLIDKQLTLYDKMGRKHSINLDNMEFCIQRRAQMLCDVLLAYKEERKEREAKTLIHELFQLLLSEYRRGLGDQDHALMQNTGIVDGKPMHIDVGQFVWNEEFKKPFIFHQELFTKMYKFKNWLHYNYPELEKVVEDELQQIIGDKYLTMKPLFRKKELH